MSNKATSAAPRADHQPHKDHDLEDAKALLNTYSRPLLLAAVVVIAFLSVTYTVRNRAAMRVAAASEALAQARSAIELEDIVADYPSTPSAPIALLALGRLQYDQGSYTEARSTYQRFLADYPRHPMALSAELGRIHAVEAQGTPAAVAAAATDYERFLTDHPQHYLAPLASFGRARTLVAEGDPEAALDLYRHFIEAYPDSHWLQLVETKIEQLEGDIARGRRVTPLSESTVPVTPEVAEPPPMEPIEPPVSLLEPEATEAEDVVEEEDSPAAEPDADAVAPADETNGE